MTGQLDGLCRTLICTRLEYMGPDIHGSRMCSREGTFKVRAIVGYDE